MYLMLCEHKRTKMKLVIDTFSYKIHPKFWFTKKLCCTKCGSVIADNQIKRASDEDRRRTLHSLTRHA